MEAGFFIIGLVVGVIATMVAVCIAFLSDDKKKTEGNPWHEFNESPENNTHVLVYNEGHYHVVYYRDAMYDFYGNYFTNRVDRWMYIPGNVKHKAPKQ